MTSPEMSCACASCDANPCTCGATNSATLADAAGCRCGCDVCVCDACPCLSNCGCAV